MAALEEEEIARIVEPYLANSSVPVDLYRQLAVYLDLLLKWNSRTNLTSIRDPEAIVSRHFGESLFLACHLPTCDTLLDYGSGAGFPGIPVQLFSPSLRVTLAESQGKKVAFLREVVRALGVNTEVWGRRVEAMPVDRTFDVVALRAVDKMEAATASATKRVAPGGKLALLTMGSGAGLPIQGSKDRALVLIDC